MARMPKSSTRLDLDPESLLPGDTAATRVASPEAARRRDEVGTRGDSLVGLIEQWASDDTLEPALKKRCDRLGRRLREDLRKLSDALERGAAADVEADRRALTEVLTRLFPGGVEGERVISLLGFLAEYGDSGLDAIYRCAEHGDGRLRLLLLSGERESCPNGI